ncbi:MAG: hypothetical protein KC776_37155 [Myxococcales bacterium]|nr:hypothetical protein [Myxococcales bacterium]MCB9577614.1 hypothetical protein [Polyangiaceae bacterium]
MTERYRVVVAFEAAADAAAATRQAIELAEQLRAELFGVFVEEVEALRLAALPFATLVDRSGRTSPLRPATVEAGWKSAASRAESNLSRAADRARIPASFGVARGRLLGALRSLSQGRDLILLGETRARRARPGPVVVIARSRDQALGLLPIAEALGGPGPLRVVLPPDGDEPPLSGSGKPVAVQESEPFDAEAIGALLAPSGARLVLIAADAPWLDEGSLPELRRRVGCPLVLVRT